MVHQFQRCRLCCHCDLSGNHTIHDYWKLSVPFSLSVISIIFTMVVCKVWLNLLVRGVAVMVKTHPAVEILRLSLSKPLGCLLLKCLPQMRTTRSNDGCARYLAEVPCFLTHKRWNSSAYCKHWEHLSALCSTRDALCSGAPTVV